MAIIKVKILFYRILSCALIVFMYLFLYSEIMFESFNVPGLYIAVQVKSMLFLSCRHSWSFLFMLEIQLHL